MLNLDFRLACLIITTALAILGNAVAVRGIQAGVNPRTGRRPFRQEFSTFKNSGPAFDLYIQALQRFQQRDQTALLSYFQVAGIHGVPFRSWDGVDGNNNAGYCTHASTLFPTWHRPYIALYEVNTVRYPDAAGQSQPDLANKQLQANGAALHTLTYQLITQQPEYGPFSNTGYSDGRGGRYNSIENMHNGIHMLVGNGGHMSNIPYSSFDPIFWLHHANVDRLFALWQAIYPDSRVTPQVNTAGTFTNDPGTTEDIDTPLTPFHWDNSGQLWTSATVWSTRTFGYTYPEIVDWGINNSQLASDVKSRINVLYNPTGSISRRSESEDKSSELQLSPNAMDAQWFVNVRVQKSAATSPFFVHLFLGAAPTDPATWSFASNLVGSHAVVDTSLLSSANPNLPIVRYGQIPLNHALLAAGNSDLAPSNIIPILTSQLSWRLQNLDDSPLDVGQVPSLKIHVVGQEVKQTVREDQFPEYGPLKVFRQVTRGKDGGLGDNDDAD
ncbi:MAG: hypothetical protein LQ343_004205 [Gyalolechia ehrenbergii]|nr:MAG: hypothetical protein LQ343_004205 [Gyalolechia ehrenbergii]